MNACLRKGNIHIRRETQFRNIVEKKVLDNSFFIRLDTPDDEALSALCKDEIIKYDAKQYAYFITHDIYEEWGIEKFIDYKYVAKSNYEGFIDSIGSSLPIRRAFRNWLSDRLFDNDGDIKELIGSLITSNNVESYWKDEILVSVLLSDYSDKFFELFKDKLLENNQTLLLRVIFMLRIACKGLDCELMKMLLVKQSEWIQSKYLLTVPKGKGWVSTIKFIYENIHQIESKNMVYILNLLNDWVSKNKNEISTKHAGKICLHYYNNTKLYAAERKQLANIILNSAASIKNEVGQILDNILSSDGKNNHYEISSLLLDKPLEAINTIKLFPDEIFGLARKKWLYVKKDHEFYDEINHSVGIEHYFGLSCDTSYSPASAFQTPILILLHTHLYKTLNFIISFINETTEKYAQSKLKQSDYLESLSFEVDGKIIKQYASERLWQIYRGTAVAPDLLESIHMALERFLLEIAEKGIPEAEEILIKILTETNSASLSAVVASIVTAYPDKFYNTAKILFSVDSFFRMDLHRKVRDFLPLEMFGFCDKMYKEDRQKSNRLDHRKLSLEDIALSYQIFEKENDIVDVETRRKELHEIWDRFYTKISQKEEQTKYDINLRFSLARIDSRKLEIASIIEDEAKKQKQLIFKSKLDTDLDKIRRSNEESRSEDMKYINSGLSTWAEKKFKNEVIDNNKYEKNPLLAFAEMKEIVEKKNKTESFRTFYHSLPAYISTVLIRDFSEQLSQEEKDFCKNIMLKFASKPLISGYHFQYSDGTEPTITCLNNLIGIFPDTRDSIKLLLLKLLLSYEKSSSYAVICVLKMWENDFELAQQIWILHLQLKPEFDEVSKKAYSLWYENKNNESEKIYDKFHKKLYESSNNGSSGINLEFTQKTTIDNFNIAFQMLPDGSTNPIHKDFSIKAILKFATVISDDDIKSKHNRSYKALSDFSRKLAYFALKLPKNETEIYLEPLIERFQHNDSFANLLTEIAVAEDVVQENEKFWYIWLLFYEKIKDRINNGKENYRDKKVIINYLLAFDIMCVGNAKEWHSLKQENLNFYYNIAKDMGQSEHVLFSLAKVFNYIAYNYLEDAFEIIFYCLNNYDYSGKEIDANTIYYTEQIIRRFILSNRQKIKTSTKLRNKTIKILDFLIEHASVFAYMLRENIL